MCLSLILACLMKPDISLPNCIPETQRSSTEPPVPQASNWTGQMDLDTDPIIVSDSNSEDYIMALLCEEDGSLDWSNQEDSTQNTWQDVSTPMSDITTDRPKEENKGDEVTTAYLPTPTTAQKKDSFRDVMSSWWKPWSYLTGNNEEKKDTTPSHLTTVPGVISTTALKVSSSTKATTSPESGKDDQVFSTFLLGKKNQLSFCFK